VVYCNNMFPQKKLMGHCSFLYVNMANVTSIQVMSLPGKGQATKLQTLDIAGPANAVGLPISTCICPESAAGCVANPCVAGGSNVQGMTVFVKA
jgi:hypothetical protein